MVAMHSCKDRIAGLLGVAEPPISVGPPVGAELDHVRQPILNVPPVIIAILAAFCIVHAVRMLVLSNTADIQFLLLFSFIPARYSASALFGGVLPGGWGADIWTFVTYAFIHADLTHLGFNALWLLPFGSALARRFGIWRFLAFFGVTAAAGAAAHLATHAGAFVPVVGASAAISGTMAAAMRFAFQQGGPLASWRDRHGAPDLVPAASLIDALRDRRVLAFLAVWFGLNVLFGLGSLSLSGNEQTVAWQAHVGGFLAGLLLFAAFDPVARPAVGRDDRIEPRRW
jgi:membrane associated rhomboid family serine protease